MVGWVSNFFTMCICKNRCYGANWYREKLAQSEWLRDKKACHRFTVILLDILLILFYILIGLIVVTLIYLICVGMGYPFAWLAEKPDARPPKAAITWALAPILAFLIIFFLWSHHRVMDTALLGPMLSIH